MISEFTTAVHFHQIHKTRRVTPCPGKKKGLVHRGLAYTSRTQAHSTPATLVGDLSSTHNTAFHTRCTKISWTEIQSLVASTSDTKLSAKVLQKYLSSTTSFGIDDIPAVDLLLASCEPVINARLLHNLTILADALDDIFPTPASQAAGRDRGSRERCISFTEYSKKRPSKRLTCLADGVEDVCDIEGRSPVLVEYVRADLSRVCLDIRVVDPRHKLYLLSPTINKRAERWRIGGRKGGWGVFTVIYLSHVRRSFIFHLLSGTSRGN